MSMSIRVEWWMLAYVAAAAACGPRPAGAPGAGRPAAPAATGSAPAPRPARLAGRLVGHDGRPMAMAHVTVDGRAHEVAADGSFSVDLPADRFVRVRLTGVDHVDDELGLLGGSDVEVDVRLGTYPRPDALDALEVLVFSIGAGGELAPLRTVSMTRRADGVWTADIPATGPIAYEITGLTAEPGRSMNAPGRGPYRYDGDGNYATVARPTGGKVVVEVDPSALPPAGVATRVSFRRAEPVVAKVAGLPSRIARARRFGDDAARVTRAEVDAERDPTAHAALAIAYFATRPPPPGPDPDASLARAVLADVPSASPLWSMAPDAAAQVVVAANREAPDYSYVEEVLSAVDDDEAAAETLFALMWRARGDGREQDVARYYELMRDRYGRTRYARLASMFDPSRRVRPGAPVPAFDVPRYGGGDRITPKTYAGHTVLIDVWATWCKPCVAEMPHLHAAYERYRGAGFRILSVCVDDTADHVDAFRRDPRHPMPWDHAVVDGEDAAAFKQALEVAGLPTLLLVGPDGTIIATGLQLRGGGLEAILARRFGAR
ncbi:MAG: TlpA family protein disulfide reductase [Deltaproteobacteria bacterium]|nr:MAG: TlpA family protein disulfide reductase [Deltaproteobacteria bacterium]